MSAPAGACEWCGGSQHWTIIRGDMYVTCDGGCLPLEGLGLTPPLDAPELIRAEDKPKMELSDEEGVCPPEGADADETERSIQHIGVPLEAVLRNLWKGGPWLEAE